MDRLPDSLTISLFTYCSYRDHHALSLVMKRNHTLAQLRTASPISIAITEDRGRRISPQWRPMRYSGRRCALPPESVLSELEHFTFHEPPARSLLKIPSTRLRTLELRGRFNRGEHVNVIQRQTQLETLILRLDRFAWPFSATTVTTLVVTFYPSTPPLLPNLRKLIAEEILVDLDTLGTAHPQLRELTFASIPSGYVRSLARASWTHLRHVTSRFVNDHLSDSSISRLMAHVTELTVFCVIPHDLSRYLHRRLRRITLYLCQPSMVDRGRLFPGVTIRVIGATSKDLLCKEHPHVWFW